MKKKTIITVCIIALMMAGMSTFAKENPYGKLDTRYDKFKVSKTIDERNMIEKVKNEVKDAWEDVEKYNDINKKYYSTITLSDLGDLNNNPEKYLDSSEVDVKYILKVISSYRKELPIGSVLPLIYIKKDGKEVIVAYKESDGTNVYKKSKIEKSTESIKNNDIQKIPDDLNKIKNTSANWKEIKSKRSVKGKEKLKITN
ncbi:hypothetical protein [Wukongibacter sp. M2B1]|uniref:hypothetical protein n=1 Tax=Wukongibacter sp. M2B1 TaxID=3088895 RepID=UPI003D7BBB50